LKNITLRLIGMFWLIITSSFGLYIGIKFFLSLHFSPYLLLFIIVIQGMFLYQFYALLRKKPVIIINNIRDIRILYITAISFLAGFSLAIISLFFSAGVFFFMK